MNKVLLSLGLLLGVAVASPALACQTTVYGSGWSDYLLQDIRFNVGESVLQGGATRTCGRHSFDVWTSYGLSGNDDYGNRGFEDEWDFTYTFADTYQSPIGPLRFEASIAYWMLADLGDADDDLIGSYVQVGRPFSVGPLAVTPYVRFTQWIGVDLIEDQTLARPGIGLSLPLGGDWNASGDLSQTNNLTMGDSHLRGSATLSYSLSETTSLWVGGKFAEDADPALGFGFSRTLN